MRILSLSEAGCNNFMTDFLSCGRRRLDSKLNKGKGADTHENQ